MKPLKVQDANLIWLGVLALFIALAGEVYRRAELKAWSASQSAFRDEAELIQSSLETNLNHPESCSQMLAGLPFVAEGKTPVMLNYSYDMEGPLTKNSEVTRGIGISALEIEPLTSHADLQTQIADYPGQTLKRWPAELHLTLEPRHQSAAQAHWAGARKIELRLPFFAWVDGFGKILSCFGRASAAELCNDFGGYYIVDRENPPEGSQRCRQSASTEAFVDGRWQPRGSCRYLGIVKRAEDCTDRFHQASTAVTYSENSHQCLVCD